MPGGRRPFALAWAAMKIARLVPAVFPVAFLLSALAASTPVIRGTENSADGTRPPASADAGSGLPVVQAVLVAPPFVPPPITRRSPARVVVNLEVREVVERLANGVDYPFLTYGGSVPGSFLRVRQGDVVEFNLRNHASSQRPHSIDLHAVTGPGGGAGATVTAPGQATRFSFQALHAGLYVYHSASAPVAMHVASGMYGLILVEPPEGLPAVEREYYVMQGEFYTTGRHGETGLQAFDAAKAFDERAPYVVFNGSVRSLVGDQALTAARGERVRIYFGVGGPNLASSFHIIGESFDRVWAGGGFGEAQRDVATVPVSPGAAAVVELKADVPGTFVLVDHALSRAFDKGALAMLNVSGEANPAIYAGADVNAVYLGADANEALMSARNEAELAELFAVAVKANPVTAGLAHDLQGERGRQVYLGLCFACHQPDGKGVPQAFPALAKSDYMIADRTRAIRIVLHGLAGPITVNGQSINNVMPAQESALTDQQIADVLTYVFNAWGNRGEPFTPEQVRAVRYEKP